MSVEFNCPRVVIDIAKWPTNSYKNTASCVGAFISGAFFNLSYYSSFAVGMSIYSGFHVYENMNDKKHFIFKSEGQKEKVITKLYVETILLLDTTNAKAEKQLDALLQKRGFKIFKQFKIFPDQIRKICKRYPNDKNKRKSVFERFYNKVKTKK